MNRRQFIRENRSTIDSAINSVIYRHDGNGGRGTIPDPPPKRNDDERAQWLDNDEHLYLWCKSECGT